MEYSVDSTFDDAYQNGGDSYILNSYLLFKKKNLAYFICLHNFLNGETWVKSLLGHPHWFPTEVR